MKIAREAQIKQKEHFQAVQAERERQVFERILQSQIEEVSFSPKKDGSSDGKIRPGPVKHSENDHPKAHSNLINEQIRNIRMVYSDKVI